MAKITAKKLIAPCVQEYTVETPLIAKKCHAGQFVMIRTHKFSERIPLTIADFDRTAGTITLVVQEVGNTTRQMGADFHVGDDILDILGPLGHPSEIENYGKVVCIGGGIGTAPVYPIARALKEAGNTVISVIGARNQDMIIFKDRMEAISDELHITTDDGSCGQKGFVTDALKDILANHKDIKRIIAIGPVVMMKSVADYTREHNIPTIASLNTIMVDGTGMCGGCRVLVGGENKFACVDGPEFDAHLVDFANLLKRQVMYKDQESQEYGCGGNCKCVSK